MRQIYLIRTFLKWIPKTFWGNYLILYCHNASILLAHLKQNSLKVAEGDLAQVGQVLAQVGNTGNTTEPHLHMHAVAGLHKDVEEITGTAEGIPMLFNGKFLIRNDRIHIQ